MKNSGRYSRHEEIEMNPEKPFLTDLKKDIIQIEKNYIKKEANEIKKLLIKELLDSLK